MADCPPPTFQLQPDGSVVCKPHCWTCAPAVSNIRHNPPAPEGIKQRPRDPWRACDIAAFALRTCGEPGHSYQWVIENFSGGKVTKQGTPEEFVARLKCLYASRPLIAKEVERQSHGLKRLPEKRFRGEGVRRDGKSNHVGVLMVVDAAEGPQ